MQIKYILPFIVCSVLSMAQEPRPILWNNEVDSVKLPSKKQTRFRFETRGKTKVDFGLEFDKGSDPSFSYELVKLPSKNTEKESTVSRSILMKSNVSVDLEEGGVYELRLKNTGKQPASYQIKANCIGDCFRNTVKVSDYVSALAESSGEQIGNSLEQKLKEFGIENPHLVKAVKSKDYSKLDTIATLQKLSDIKQITPMLTEKGSTPKVDEKINGRFEKQLAKYPVDTAKAMAPVIEKPVPIQWGHHYSKAFSQKEINQSEGLAKILTSLSVDNGSSVTVTQNNNEKKLTAPEDVFKYLLETGHQIRVDFEKVNANFLAFADGNTNILFPTWVKTGIKLPSGKELTVPMNHNQITWKISGPLVNARVSAFHGIGGVGFSAVTDDRPGWAKAEVKNLLDSNKGDGQNIIKSIEAAKNLVRLNRCERQTIAKGAPADGYGMLGVCNDSTAYILSQLKVRPEDRPLYPYPMVRPAAFNDNECKKTEKDPYASLPHDADDTNPDKTALLERVLAGVPRHSDGSPMLNDPELLSQIKEAEELLKTLKNSNPRDNRTNNTH